jgi:hypothetical protein
MTEYIITNHLFFEDGTSDRNTETFNTYKDAMGYANCMTETSELPPNGVDFTVLETVEHAFVSGRGELPDEWDETRRTLTYFI